MSAPGRIGLESESDGSFEIRGLVGERCFLTASAAGYDRWRNLDAPAVAEDVQVVLGRLGSITGRVTTDTGAPAAEVVYSLSASAAEGGRFM